MKSTLAIYDAMLEAKFPAAAARGVAEALEMDSRFEAIDTRFERLELRLTVKLGVFLSVAVGLIVTLQQLLR